MERARATWTDERLDDLSQRVDAGFARVEGDMRAMGSRHDARFTELSQRIDAQGAELSARIDALQRTMFQIGAMMGGGFIATLAGVILTRG